MKLMGVPKLPCKNCLVFPMCKKRLHDNDFVKTSDIRYLNKHCIAALCVMCNIFDEYMYEIGTAENSLLNIPYEAAKDITNFFEIYQNR